MELVLTFITVTAFPPPRTHTDITGRWSSVFVWPPVWGQFHGHLTKLDVLFPWWSRAKATRSGLQNFTSLTHRTAHHYKDVASKHLLRLLLSISSPPPLFFQSLLTGLMYYRPDDPIDYLEGCLKKVRELGGTDKVRWDTFVGQEKKSLPPLNGGQSRRSLFRNGEQRRLILLMMWRKHIRDSQLTC